MRLNDYEVDRSFGRWLLNCREREELSLSQASILSDISPGRLKQLEAGAGKGVTIGELKALCGLYRMQENEGIDRAVGTIYRRVRKLADTSTVLKPKPLTREPRKEI